MVGFGGEGHVGPLHLTTLIRNRNDFMFPGIYNNALPVRSERTPDDEVGHHKPPRCLLLRFGYETKLRPLFN